VLEIPVEMTAITTWEAQARKNTLQHLDVSTFCQLELQNEMYNHNDESLYEM